MRIEKYNQRLLAILGTIGVIFLLVALMVFILEIRWSNNYSGIETGILSEEKIQELQNANKRKQLISYENPILIDILNATYIIPVSHKTLEEQEDIHMLLDLESSNYEKKDRRYSANIYGAFNNIVVYDAATGTSEKIFDKRVNFNNIKTEYFEDDVLMLLSVSEEDTYRDGVINLLDFKTLYVYSFQQRKLKSIGINGMDVFDFQFLNNTKDLIIRFGVDKNLNGKYEAYNEPTIIKKYNFETGELMNIVDEKISSELQKTLEGSKN